MQLQLKNRPEPATQQESRICRSRCASSGTAAADFDVAASRGLSLFSIESAVPGVGKTAYSPSTPSALPRRMGIFPSKRRSIGLLSAFLAHAQVDRVDSVGVVASLPAAAATLLLLAIARLRHSRPRRRRFAAEAPCWSAFRPIDACDASPIMAKQHQPRRRSVCLAFPGLSYTTTILSLSLSIPFITTSLLQSRSTSLQTFPSFSRL